MNIREYNKMNMFTAVNAVLQLYGKVTTKIEALATAAENFNEKLSLITDRDAQYTTASSGATASKNSAAEVLTASTLQIANALLAFGNVTGDEQLKAECNLSQSKLLRRRTLELTKISGRIAELARQYAAELGSYGITKSDLASHAADIKSFLEMREQQQESLTEVKSARGLLYDDMTDANNLLRKQIDPLMELVKRSNAEFYNQYKAARVIKDLRGRSRRKDHGENVSAMQTATSGSAQQTAAA